MSLTRKALTASSRRLDLSCNRNNVIACNYTQQRYTKSIPSGVDSSRLVSFCAIGRFGIIRAPPASFTIILIIVLLTRSIRQYLMISRRNHVTEHVISDGELDLELGINRECCHYISV